MPADEKLAILAKECARSAAWSIVLNGLLTGRRGPYAGNLGAAGSSGKFSLLEQGAGKANNPND